MSVQAALEFFRALRETPPLQAELAGVQTHAQLAEAASAAGFPCRAEDVARAFVVECGLRRAAHRPPAQGGEATC